MRVVSTVYLDAAQNQPLQFHMLTQNDMRDILAVDGLRTPQWEAAPPEARAQTLQHLEDACALFEHRPVANVVVTKLSDAVSEQYDSASNTLRVSPEHLAEGSATQVGPAVAHEGRHALQIDAAKHPERHPEIPPSTIAEWRDNIAHYIPSSQHPVTYAQQPIEKDAFLFEKEVQRLLILRDRIEPGLTA